MVNISDDCCCEDKALKEQIKDRALSSINKIYTTDDRTYYPDGTGMVTVPLPTQAQLNQIETNKEDIAALNEEMDGIDAKIQEGDATLDAKIDAVDATLDAKIDAVDATLSEAIAANVAEIATVDKAVDELSGKVAASIPTEYRLYRTGEGKIQLQAETADGTLIDSNTLDMVIPYQYDLIAGTTDRSFKIRITLSNGTSYDTNDFIIPTPGDAPVEVTGIIMSKDPDNANRFKVGVNLSDGSMIETGYVTFVDSVEATVEENKLTVAVNDVESVPTNVVTSVAADYSDSVLTVAVNGVSDSVTIESSSGENSSDSPYFVSILANTVKIQNEDGSDVVIPAATQDRSEGVALLTSGYNFIFTNTTTSTDPTIFVSKSDKFNTKIDLTGPSTFSKEQDTVGPLYITDSVLSSIIPDIITDALNIKSSFKSGTLTIKCSFYFTKPNASQVRVAIGSDITYDLETKTFSIPDNVRIYTTEYATSSNEYINFNVYVNSVNFKQKEIIYKITSN